MELSKRIEIETIMAIHLDVHGYNGDLAPMMASGCKSKEDVPKVIGKLNAMLDAEVNKRIKGASAPKCLKSAYVRKSLTLEDVKKMTPEQINANWANIKDIL
jgi:hypothetical protein